MSPRLCCANYFKTTYMTCREIGISSLRKPVQLLPIREEVNLLNSNIQRTSASNPLCFNHVIQKKADYVNGCCNKPYNLVTRFPQNDLSNSSLSVLSNQRYFMKPSTLNHKPAEDKSSVSHGLPSEEQLEAVFQELSRYLPKLFLANVLDAQYYNTNIVLENRFRGTQTIGLTKYYLQLSLLKIIGHIKFAYVKFEILKITKHPEEGTIKCRWRINGIPGMKVIFQFWKFRPGKFSEEMEQAPTWFDGFSIYIVGSDGKINRHIIDKMMPDDDRITIDKSIASKVTLFSGLRPGDQDIFRSTSQFPS